MTALVERTALANASPRQGVFSALVAVGSRARRAEVVHHLAALGGNELVEAGSIAEARVRAMATGPRDLAVVALSLPDGSGLGLLADLRAAGWLRGVVLSPLADPYTVRAVLAGGARAFLVVPDGPLALDPPLGSQPRTRLTGVHGLSGREIEVLQLVADGRSNRDIGGVLGLSGLTVKSHLARIARKLGTGDRAEMVIVALRAGVIT